MLPPDPTTFTVDDLARRWRVSPDKVRLWIAAGELTALNTAASPGGRPRWRIALDAVLAFESRRASSARKTPSVRRRKQTGVIEYF
jgi:hypothetical protein